MDSSYIHAATTLGDLVTRQVEITDTNAENFYATVQALVASDDNLKVTMTSVSYNATDEEYFVNWSSSNIDGEEHENDDIERFSFPAMEETESVMLVVVEGSVDPLFSGLFDGQVQIVKHSIRRPRLVRLVDRKA